MASGIFFVFVLFTAISMASCASKATSTNATAVGNVSLPAFMMRRAVSGIYVITWKLKLKSNATEQMMLKKYTFINTRLRLIPPILRLGIVSAGSVNCRTMSVQDRFNVLYRQFSAFIDPVKLACQFHFVPVGSKNYDLFKSWSYTRINLHQTVVELHKILTMRNMTIPTVNKVSESSMNNMTESFLIRLQKNNLGVPPTDTNVKIYRNYIIVSTLRSMIVRLQSCIPT
ncbi:hypothetical protein AC249_AIPGENE19396 [Exaiptasia diaphana]|nr:hypothetical protein AC249_AIPGENE19396 [Exaiptasia diaphana]